MIGMHQFVTDVNYPYQEGLFRVLEELIWAIFFTLCDAQKPSVRARLFDFQHKP